MEIINKILPQAQIDMNTAKIAITKLFFLFGTLFPIGLAAYLSRDVPISGINTSVIDASSGDRLAYPEIGSSELNPLENSSSITANIPSSNNGDLILAIVTVDENNLNSTTGARTTIKSSTSKTLSFSNSVANLSNGNLLCTANVTEIAGVVFEDFGYDGLYDPNEYLGVKGVPVTATDSLDNSFTAVTD